MESTELIVEDGLRVMLLMLELTDFLDESPESVVVVDFSDCFIPSGASGVNSESIFITTEEPVEAGMNKVVTPFFLITVL